MTSTSPSRRRTRRSAGLAALLTLCVAGTAQAAVTGTVTNSLGQPVADVSIRATEADGSSAGFATTTGAGTYSIDTTGDTAPFTVAANYRDPCRPYTDPELTATSAPLPDGAVQNILIDARSFCAPAFTPSGQPEATGNVWTERNQVLSYPGGITHLRVQAPYSATGFQVTLADGTVIGGGTSASLVTITAPAAGYSGPINLSYTDGGAPVSRALGTLIDGKVSTPKPPVGISDLAAVVDVSGSMSGNDPTNRRRDAVNLLIDLAGQGDRLLGAGFDSGYKEIFPRTTIAGASTKSALKAAARRNIGNFGGTDYNIGLGTAFASLSADPLNPTVPKSAIFLTDGANGGTYDNVHLRYAFNGTAAPWPICVVQLGRGFQPGDTARLKRIATETGGTFAKAPNNAQLESLYFQCRGRSSGQSILLKKTNTFRVGQTRGYAKTVKKNQRSATFFVSWGVGRYQVRLVQPGGKVLTRSVGKRVRFVTGKSSKFFQVQNPKAGLWRVRVTRLKTGAVTDTATTTVTVQRRR
jgi:hypothetical protein